MDPMCDTSLLRTPRGRRYSVRRIHHRWAVVDRHAAMPERPLTVYPTRAQARARAARLNRSPAAGGPAR